MRIVFIGSGAFALPTLRWLAQSEHDVPLVVTQPARPSGRGRRITPTPVRALADELGLETLEAMDVNAPEIVGTLRSAEAHVGLMIAFGQKLRSELLGLFSGGLVNLHASLLPKYRGAAPINWAITRGERQTGCTVFRVVERMDAGPILTTQPTQIKPQETAGELHDRLADIGVDAVRAALELASCDCLPEGTPQNDDQATNAPKLKKRDGFVHFDRPAAAVADHIRGMTPWPGAGAVFKAADGRWEKLNITRAQPIEDPSAPTLPPGRIDERGYVAALGGFVEILEIQPSSGRIMTWVDYVNGRHVEAGDSLVAPGK